MKDDTPVVLKLHHDGSFLSSPLAEALAKVVERLRKQWLPEEDEKTAILSAWRFIYAGLGSAFFMSFFAASIFDQGTTPDDQGTAPSDFPFATPDALVGPFDPARIAFVLGGAVFFATLTTIQRGKGGPVGVFLGGVALPALAFWITRSALS